MTCKYHSICNTKNTVDSEFSKNNCKGTYSIPPVLYLEPIPNDECDQGIERRCNAFELLDKKSKLEEQLKEINKNLESNLNF
jgi:hypothetical protein